MEWLVLNSNTWNQIIFGKEMIINKKKWSLITL